MRFVVAIVLFVTAFVAIGVGIAQRTVWAGPDSLTLTADTDSAAVLTLLEGSVLNAHEGRQSVEISGSEQVAAATGRTDDVLAWIGDARYNRIDIDPETGEFVTEVVEGSELQVPPITGSDLWLNEYTQENMLTFAVDVPEDYSMIIAADGAEPAPSNISVTWPLDNSAPWAEPLVIAGLTLLLLGLAALIWALLHLRRSRGPRRKQPRLPKPPRARRYKPAQRAMTSTGSGRRNMIATPVALAGLLAIGGSAIVATPATADPVGAASAGETAAPEIELPPTAVTESQLRRIVANIGQTVAEADEERDLKLARGRLEGAALQFRKASYEIQEEDDELGQLPVIPQRSVKLTLPQQLSLPAQGETWPRTVFTIVQDGSEESAPPVALILVQRDPRSQYKVHFAITLEPETVIPDVAPPTVGAARLPEDTKLLAVAPKDLAAAYGDVLLKGEESDFAELFDLTDDTLLPQIGVEQKDKREKKIPETAEIEFSNAPGKSETIAFATNDAGALVALAVNEKETVRPVEEGAAVNPDGAVKALSGKKQSTKGITATYGNQLLFYVPPVTEGGKIQLLGYSTSLIAASEVG
ncbi:hypothetical protein ACFFGH_12105 [Lysobacter korlensis]|uniref:DUF8094 domain-containing protein n=1 Tax=Lysobacter korlensis TaxID=553636 RepID=A0ABV6RRM9_9GAMM